MAKTDTFTSFYYDDDNQTLAHILSQFKNNKTYAVERMDIPGINPNPTDIMEFVVEAKVNAKYRKKKTDTWQSLDDFWTLDNAFAKSCPHWERTAVSVRLGLRIRGDERPDAFQRTLVTWHTWFDNKYRSQPDAIATKIVCDGYDETAAQVQADWNDDCITDECVQQNALLNGFGIIKALSQHLEQQRSAQNKKIVDMLV